MIRALLLILIATPVLADGPKWSYKDNPKLDDEISSIYYDIRKPRTRDHFSPMTLAQLKTVIPSRVGIPFYCSDCASTPVCVSTGTTIFGVSGIAGKTTTCQ